MEGLRDRTLANSSRECLNEVIETGVLHEVGLRNTLEPDPDNTGVGSFRSRTAFFLDFQRSLVSWKLETRGIHVQFRRRRSGQHRIAILRAH
jgi:hypothetical protein